MGNLICGDEDDILHTSLGTFFNKCVAETKSTGFILKTMNIPLGLGRKRPAEKGLGPQQVSGNYQAIYLFRFKSASFMPRGEVGCRARPPSIRGRKPRNTSRSSGPCHPGFTQNFHHERTFWNLELRCLILPLRGAGISWKTSL